MIEYLSADVQLLLGVESKDCLIRLLSQFPQETVNRDAKINNLNFSSLRRK